MNEATRFTRGLLVVTAGSIAVPAASEALAQSSPAGVALQWSVPTTLPPSARVAVAAGDPTGPGETTFLIAMPNGYRIPPHFHPGDVQLEVKEGTLLIGMGDQLDPKRTQALAAGDSAGVPAGRHHFWIASGRTVAALRFSGPFTITYLRAEEAPRPRVYPFGY